MNDQSTTIPSTTPTASAPTTSPARPVATRTKLLLEGPIFATLLRLAAPNILNLVAFVEVITFDGFFLGQIGTDALAGASLAFPWIMLILQTTNSGMGAGVSSAVARACCNLFNIYDPGRSFHFWLDGGARHNADRRTLIRQCCLWRRRLHHRA